MGLLTMMIPEGVIQCFRVARLEEAVTIYQHLLKHGYTMDHLSKYLVEFRKEQEKLREEFQKEREKRRKEWVKEWEAIAPKCPNCGLYLNPPKHICKKKGPENVKGYTCLWFCTNGDCTYEKYTYDNANEEMKQLMERRMENARTL